MDASSRRKKSSTHTNLRMAPYDKRSLLASSQVRVQQVKNSSSRSGSGSAHAKLAILYSDAATREVIVTPSSEGPGNLETTRGIATVLQETSESPSSTSTTTVTRRNPNLDASTVLDLDQNLTRSMDTGYDYEGERLAAALVPLPCVDDGLFETGTETWNGLSQDDSDSESTAPAALVESARRAQESVIVEQNAGEQVSGSTSAFVSLEEDSDMSENEPVLPGALPVFSSSSSSATTSDKMVVESPKAKAKVMSSFKGQSVASGSSNEWKSSPVSYSQPGSRSAVLSQLEQELGAIADAPDANAPVSKSEFANLLLGFMHALGVGVVKTNDTAPPAHRLPSPPSESPRAKFVRTETLYETHHNRPQSSSSIMGSSSPPTRPPAPAGFLPVYGKGKPRKYNLAQTKHRDPTMTSIQAHVRMMALTFLGRRSRKEGFKPGPTAQQKAGAKRGVAAPDPQDPRLDLSGKGVRSDWNKQVAVMFGAWYTRLSGALTRDPAVAEEAFLAHIPALCLQAKNQLAEDDEMDEEAAAVINNRRRSRRRKLAHRRWEDTFLLACFAAIREWINRLGTDGTSEDESEHYSSDDDRRRTYWIIPLEWRSKELIELLRVLDDLHLISRLKDAGKQMQGNLPRYRKLRPSARGDPKARAVVGLPRNFYDAEWLNNLSDWERRKLRIRDDVHINLSIPEEAKDILKTSKKGKGKAPLL